MIGITNERYLHCPEKDGEAANCRCRTLDKKDKIEKLHGAPEGSLSSSIDRSAGGPVFPDIARPTCLFIDKRNVETRKTTGDKWKDGKWNDSACRHFRIIR
ncbi:MAG: hypothetical protein AB8G05_27760 [Oligoflexales bacterium]